MPGDGGGTWGSTWAPARTHRSALCRTMKAPRPPNTRPGGRSRAGPERQGARAPLQAVLHAGRRWRGQAGEYGGGGRLHRQQRGRHPEAVVSGCRPLSGPVPPPWRSRSIVCCSAHACQVLLPMIESAMHASRHAKSFPAGCVGAPHPQQVTDVVCPTCHSSLHTRGLRLVTTYHLGADSGRCLGPEACAWRREAGAMVS